MFKKTGDHNTFRPSSKSKELGVGAQKRQSDAEHLENLLNQT